MNILGFILSKITKKFKNISVLFLVFGLLLASGYSSVKAEIKDDSKSENISSSLTISGVDEDVKAEAIKQGKEARQKVAALKKDASLSATAKRILDKADEAKEQGNDELYLEKIREYSRIFDDKSIKRKAESKVLLARVLFSQLKLQEAQRAIEEAVALEPNNIEYRLTHAKTLQGNGQYQKMIEVSLEAVLLIENQEPVDKILLAKGLNTLGGAYLFGGQYDLAVSPFEQALQLRKELLGEEHYDVAVSLNELALLYKSQGRYSEAEPLYLQALELVKKLVGEEHPSVATSLNNLAGLYYSQGRYSEAEPLYLQALELNKKLLGEYHPDVAVSLNNLAELYRAQGIYSEAEPLHLEVLELSKKLLGEEHPYVATSLNNLAGLYLEQKQYSKAEPLFLQALELRKKLLGEYHPNVAVSLNNLAGLYRAQGRYSEAETLYERALKIAEATLGVDHPNTNAIKENLQYNLDLMNQQR